jgi:hypothetical protein
MPFHGTPAIGQCFLHVPLKFQRRRQTVNETIRRQADQYRQKAEEVRASAEQTKDLVCRDALRRLADGYDRLADNLDRVASRAGWDQAEQKTGS